MSFWVIIYHHSSSVSGDQLRLRGDRWIFQTPTGVFISQINPAADGSFFFFFFYICLELLDFSFKFTYWTLSNPGLSPISDVTAGVRHQLSGYNQPLWHHWTLDNFSSHVRCWQCDELDGCFLSKNTTADTINWVIDYMGTVSNLYKKICKNSYSSFLSVNIFWLVWT